MSIRDIVPPSAINQEIPVDLSAFVKSSFINEFPLATRLTRRPIGSNHFDIITHGPRPTTLTLGANIAADDTATITLSNVSALLLGDVLEIGAERVEVIAEPTISNTTTGAGTVGVQRAVEGTTAANSTSSASTHSSTNTVYLIGNSRTGREVDQKGYRTKRTLTRQFVQTFQFPIQVGGRTAALTDTVLPAGAGAAQTPDGGPILAREEEDKLRDMMISIEGSSLYGLGEDGATAATGRYKQKGVRTLALAASNLITDPTNKTAYKPVDMERDIVQKLADKGGVCDLLLCSTNIGLGFSTWGQASQAVPAGATEFGTPITVYLSALFPGLPIWYTRGLRPFTIVGLDTRRVRMRVLRPEMYQARGKRGDAHEGDWLCDMAVEIEDPEQSVAWVEGITTFAPPLGVG